MVTRHKKFGFSNHRIFFNDSQEPSFIRGSITYYIGDIYLLKKSRLTNLSFISILNPTLHLIISSSDTNYKVRDEFLCRSRLARKYICPTIAGYLLVPDNRFVFLSPSLLERLHRTSTDMPSFLYFIFSHLELKDEGGI